VVDLIPVVLADMLGVKIVIVSQMNGKAISSTFNQNETKTVVLILENNHYNYTDLRGITGTVSEWLKISTNGNCDDTTNQTIDPAKNYRRPTLTLPYKSDVASKRINLAKRDLRSGGEFNIVFRSTAKLSDVVRKVNAKERSGGKSHFVKKGVPIDMGSAKKVSGVVYGATCLKCKEKGINTTYVGETGRALSVRIKEHCAKTTKIKANEAKTSALGQHSVCVHDIQPKVEDWEFVVHQFSDRTQERRPLEAFEIRRHKPSLNRDTGVHLIIDDFVM